MSWLWLLLWLSLQEGRPPIETLRSLREAASANPEKAELQYELGALYASYGRTAEALQALGRAAELAPTELEYRLAYGEALYRVGRAQEAVPHLEQARERPEALLLLASAHEALGDSAKMLAELEAYVKAAPTDEGARFLLGTKLEEAKRIDEALDVYRGGSDAESLARAAELLSRRPEALSEAESCARKALGVEPAQVEARVALARVLSRTGREAEALTELERGRDASPDTPQILYQLAQAYQRAGRAEEARAASARFQELSASEKSAQEREARVAVTYKRGAELLRNGKMLEAEPVFRSVLEIDPEHSQTRSMLAKIAFSRNDPGSARRWIEEAIDRAPEVAEYHYLRGFFLARTGAAAEAESSARRALELDPGFADAWSLLGSLLLDRRRSDDALQSFLAAAALEPANPAIQLNLASTYAALGDRAEEEKAMERYRELSRPR
jgi:tetratricopeptide (TPR) repeat protein